jgi:biopolymer transport protein ExbD
MLLFFFMVTTVLRESNLMVEQNLPKANQLSKLEKKTLVSYIFVGKPRDVQKYGNEPRIQLNDVLATPDEIPMFVFREKEKIHEAERDKITMSLKVDKKAKMGIVIDVKQQLREANALKINYASGKAE